MGILGNIFSAFMRSKGKADLAGTLGAVIQNGLDGKNIGDLGTVLESMGATATRFSQVSEDCEAIKRMREELPQFPLWVCGGSNFDLYDKSYDEGHLCYRFTLKGTEAMLTAYKTLLRGHGFRPCTLYPEVKVMSKKIGTETYAFIYTDAVNDDEVSVVFERNSEYPPDDFLTL